MDRRRSSIIAVNHSAKKSKSRFISRMGTASQIALSTHPGSLGERVLAAVQDVLGLAALL